MVSRFDFNNEGNNRRKGVNNKEKEQSSKGKKSDSVKKKQSSKNTEEKRGTLIFPKRNEISFRIILYAILLFIALYLVFCVYKYHTKSLILSPFPSIHTSLCANRHSPQFYILIYRIVFWNMG